MLKSEPLAYQNFNGYLAYDSSHDQSRPAVLIVPTWMGLNDFVRQKADALAELGYVAYGVDLFGDGKVAQNAEEAQKLITPLVADRQLICDRLEMALQTVQSHPLVDPSKCAAIGFCFGGMSVLELAKSGCALCGVVSIHGVLGKPIDIPSKPVPIADTIPASILVLHGYKDALSPEEALLEFEKEMAARGADWQVVVYGEAMHAFTNPEANMPELSLQYHEKTANRAWLATQNFLSEILFFAL